MDDICFKGESIISDGYKKMREIEERRMRFNGVSEIIHHLSQQNAIVNRGLQLYIKGDCDYTKALEEMVFALAQNITQLQQESDPRHMPPAPTKFPILLNKLLQMEYGKTEEQAQTLIKKYSDIMTHGIFKGNLNATAMALLMQEDRDKEQGLYDGPTRKF